MSCNWRFSWAEQINDNQPGDYIKAWQRAYDIFTQNGARKATWVLCPNAGGSTTRALTAP